MKRMDPTLAKGRKAEDRCVRLIRSLKGELPIRRVRHTGIRLDRLGIDLIVHFRLEDEKQTVKVPVEVKSSFTGVLKYHEKHPECVAAGVIVVVVAQSMSDEHISAFLRKRFEEILKEKKSFDFFFKNMRSKAAVLLLPRFYKALFRKIQYKRPFRKFFELERDDEYSFV